MTAAPTAPGRTPEEVRRLLAAIESGIIGAEALRNQVLDETAPFFRDDAQAVFGIRVWTAVRCP